MNTFAAFRAVVKSRGSRIELYPDLFFLLSDIPTAVHAILMVAK